MTLSYFGPSPITARSARQMLASSDSSRQIDRHVRRRQGPVLAHHHDQPPWFGELDGCGVRKFQQRILGFQVQRAGAYGRGKRRQMRLCHMLPQPGLAVPAEAWHENQDFHQQDDADRQPQDPGGKAAAEEFAFDFAEGAHWVLVVTPP